MAEVIEFTDKTNPGPGPNGKKIHAYIQERLDFEISMEVYGQIDHAIALFWNALPLGGYLHANELKNVILSLRSEGILFSEEQSYILANLFLEALESTGFVEG